jgi:fructokinase
MRIGVDLGGTKIEALALDRDGRERGRRRVPTPRGRYGATLAAITTLVEGLERESGEPARVGVGMPGALSPATGLVKNANSVWLNGRPLRQDLERLLHRPLRFANDANCFALSEARDGAGESAPVVFGAILGTGTGGGVVVHGRVLGGPNAVAGEWGHNPLPWPRPGEWPGPACYCGRTGCIETYLSGPGISRDHREATGEDLDAAAIAARAADGDRACEATLARHEERLARALATVVNLLDPDVIVLGGGLSNLGRLYRGVPERWGAWVFSDRVDTALRPPKHGDASGVRGAAWLWDAAEDDGKPSPWPPPSAG